MPSNDPPIAMIGSTLRRGRGDTRLNNAKQNDANAEANRPLTKVVTPPELPAWLKTKNSPKPIPATIASPTAVRAVLVGAPPPPLIKALAAGPAATPPHCPRGR